MGPEGVEVHLTMVVMRGGKVERVEHATLESHAADQVLRAWSQGSPAAGRGRPAVSTRPDPWAPVFLSLSLACSVLAFVALLM